MKIFITGATGYIGGSVGVRLAAARHQVRGLCRDVAKAGQLHAYGIEPVVGDLRDESRLVAECRDADVVINAADADDAYAVQTLIAGLRGSGKTLIHTSGSSIVGDRAAGQGSPNVFNEDTPRPVRWEKLGRCEIDREVLRAGHMGVRSCVLCPCLIYGAGRGLGKESIQLPRIITTALRHGGARHIGPGENRWSTVHIDDVTAAYELALRRAPADSFFFLENGEVSLGELSAAVHAELKLPGAPAIWKPEEAAKEWSPEGAHFAFGSNSRVSAAKARALLGWQPVHSNVFADLPRCCASLKQAFDSRSLNPG